MANTTKYEDYGKTLCTIKTANHHGDISDDQLTPGIQVFVSIWNDMSVHRAVRWLHIACLYLHCQLEVRGWRPAKCKALGQCHDS